ncbi:MAG: Omp28-related outer membrane protein [Ignavibacteria bacterium]|nr:Omp28-related outer membrane protein [Ignavibacteria bacterium]
MFILIGDFGNATPYLKIAMKRYLIILLPVLLFLSCKTNPPFTPENRVSGKIFLKVNFNFVPQSKTVNKVVLLEDFANVSCVPCVTSNRIIKSLTRTSYGPEKLVAIKYPTNFPAPNDLFYLANKPVCDSKILFYNIFFAPTTVIDGIEKPSSTDSSALKQKIDARLAAAPSFEIIVTDTFISGSYYIDVQVNSLAAIDLTNLTLEAVILEEEIEFSNPPGSNGETKFYDVMRAVLPSTDGISLAAVQQSGSNLVETEADLIANWQTNQLNAVVFVQNKSSKEVLQAGISLN